MNDSSYSRYGRGNFSGMQALCKLFMLWYCLCRTSELLNVKKLITNKKWKKK